MTRVAITGATGFIGTHLRVRLRCEPDVTVDVIERDAMRSSAELRRSLTKVDFLVHLAGMNRGPDDEVEHINVELAQVVADACRDLPIHVLFASSAQRERDTPYGRGKRRAEQVLTGASRRDGMRVTVLDIGNVYGPGGRPFYNSVVATFCHQLANGQQPTVDVDRELELLWIADLVEDMTSRVVRSGPDTPEVVRIRGESTITVSGMLRWLRHCHQQHFVDRVVPRARSEIEANLYRTLVSFTPPGALVYHPELRSDDRGTLFEFARQGWSGGQTFFSTTRPGVKRGEHYHTRKFEKFCVVDGSGAIRLRDLITGRVEEYLVTGDRPAVVDIPIYQVHHVENVGDGDLLTLFWASEIFDPADPDTVAETVR